MTARQSRAVTLALSYRKRTGCTTGEASRRYKVAVTSIRRALARAGVAPNPVGRPRKLGDVSPTQT